MKRFQFLHQFLTNNQNNICCRKTQKMKQARAELDAILGGSEMPVVSSEYEDYQVMKLESLKLILMKLFSDEKPFEVAIIDKNIFLIFSSFYFVRFYILILDNWCKDSNLLPFKSFKVLKKSFSSWWCWDWSRIVIGRFEKEASCSRGHFKSKWWRWS